MDPYQTIIIPTSRTLQSFADRFWRKANTSSGCWNWTAHIDEWGYGTFQVGSRTDHTTKSVLAHRVSWELSVGPIPEGMNVLHKCDNPCCVRPDHLFLGTCADNVHDMQRKGREANRAGSKNGSAKLTERQVKIIKKEYRRGTSMYSRGNAVQLAKRFSVSRYTIWDAAVRRWNHIT